MWTEFWIPERQIEPEFSIFIEAEQERAIEFVCKMHDFSKTGTRLDLIDIYNGTTSVSYYRYDLLTEATLYMRLGRFFIQKPNGHISSSLYGHKRRQIIIPKHRRYIPFNQFLKNPEPNIIYYKADVDAILA